MPLPRWVPLPAVLRSDATLRQFLAKHAPQGRFQWLDLSANVLFQGIIDPRLVIAAARGVDLCFEPLDDVIIQSDGDPRLARRQGAYRTTARLREVVFLSHIRSP